MTWIEATAKQIACGEEHTEKDYQQAEELFAKANKKTNRCRAKAF